MDYCNKCGQHVTTLLTHDCSKVVCPQCARFREKLDREKIARLLCGGRMRWNGLFELTRDRYRSEADGLIAYLTDWEETWTR